MDNEPQLTLRDVALKASESVGGLQGRALDREAKRRGLTLSYTTVDKIIAGTYTSTPKRPTLEALAQLSGLPLEKVFRAANVPFPRRPLAELLPEDADLLSPDQKRVVIDVVRQFAKANRALESARQGTEVVGSAQHPAPMKETGETPAADDSNVHEFRGRLVSRETWDEDAATFSERAVASENEALEEEGIAQLGDP
ncbi:hypothetical protein [Oerskovia paurometabola]|uniref:hypothetical protein n=1 Tax=Oerskovia paurometabola TaxID=162170 RepID=UPI0037FE662D